MTLQNVWAPSLNGKILVTDFDGHPVADPSDFPFKEKVSGLMGTGVARNGDVWITAGADDALLGIVNPSMSSSMTRIASGSAIRSPTRSVAFPSINRITCRRSTSA